MCSTIPSSRPTQALPAHQILLQHSKKRAPLEICDPTQADRRTAARFEALHGGADADDSLSDYDDDDEATNVQQTGQSVGPGYTYNQNIEYQPLQPRVTGGRMQPPTRETAAARAQARIHRQAIGGLHLPSRMAKMVAGASAEDLVPQERPLTIMHGDLDATADIMRTVQDHTLQESDETAKSARKLGKQAMRHKVAVPEYIKHFTGKSTWEPPPMQFDVDNEEVEWRRKRKHKATISRFANERERLVDSFKRHRGDKRTDTEQEELDHRLSENESEDELCQMRKEWHRQQRLRRVQAAEAAAEAVRLEAEAAVEAARLEAEETAGEQALLEALGSSSEDDEPAPKPASSDEETDVEDRHYPDPVPAFLLDRKSSYVYISANEKRKFVVNRKLDVGRPPPNDRWWLKLTTNAASVTAAAAAAAEPDSDDEVLIDLAPPDAVDCMVY